MSEMIDSATQTYDDPDPEFGAGRASPRVEIDTSAPFGSVEEAVIRFGGRGFWAPPSSAESSEFDVCKLEEQAAEMLKDLDSKQQETLDILKELQLTKRLIEELKMKLKKESSEFAVIPPTDINDRLINLPDCSSFPPPSPAALVMTELKQAKRSLSQSTNDLEAIRASVECVNKKMDKKTTFEPEIFIGNGSPLGISRELRELNFEAEQFMRTAEAAKAEVLRAMSEIEHTKTGLRMIEMRWVAAKKMEEAAKAAEALALVEIKALSSASQPGRISLSFEEYSTLAERARKAEMDAAAAAAAQRGHNHKLTEMSLREFMRRVEVANRAHPTNPGRYEAGESGHGGARSKPVLRPSTSIGDILSRKLVLRDDLDVGRQEDRQRVSLNQMLDRHRAQSPPPRRNDKGNGGDSKGLFSKRKNLGFVHISLPVSKQSKNRIQALNLW